MKHYFDESKHTGVSLGRTLALPPSEEGGDDKNGIAWDVYLLFAPRALWQDRPPKPAYWTHQLDEVKDAPQLDAAALLQEIEKV